ncbi:histidinol-phosphate transaminase [Rhizobiaceae bacterium BDR2-2]|uniref:Histidinol-phosphate aminotransferase n=1 Tax=Ectorhizobium quercum TaxID=2965071 RepID=A0AAE3N2F8_9HYPH|nr:histidinol-phosphate transaminase [Ectorhizobium quercum]MCX8997427.1 histidinol-phosphate transaminase [Ectorhizobium quercum]
MKTAPIPYIAEAGFSVTRHGKPSGPPESWIQLASNESSFAASPAAMEAVRRAIGEIHRYPEPSSSDLRNAIAARYDLPAEQIICGNGSEAVIETIYRCYARPGDEVVFSRYSFIQFRIFAERVGATAVLVDERDYTPDIDALLAAVTAKTKIVLLANPNNPTGTWLPRSEVRRLRDNLRPDIVLVLDAAYAEYAESEDFTAGHELVAGTENVIVTRTFSKAFGLAGLRVGWAHGPLSMIRVLGRMKQIGNVNRLAQTAAIAALGDLAFVNDVVRTTSASRRRCAEALEELGFPSLPSQGNFLCTRFPDAAAVHAFLLGQGIVVRPIEDYGLGDFLRITIGSDGEMDRLIAALKQYRDEKG